MSKIKNLIANLPLYLATIIGTINSALYVLSFKLHITLNTEAGAKLKDLDIAVVKLKSALEKRATTQTNQNTLNRGSSAKLANIIRGSDDSGNSNS